MRRLPWGIISSISIQGVVFFFLERRPWEEKPRGHCPLRLQLRLSRGCDELYYGTDWRTGYPFFSLGSLSSLTERDGNGNVKKAIDYFRIPHNTLRLLPQILQRLLLSNALGKMQFSQEHLKTMVYAKFGGQTESIMGDSKIENRLKLSANGRNNSQHCWPNIVRSCCVRLHVAKRLIRFKLCATTLNN